MSEVTVAHHPELTLERALEVLRDHFGGKYHLDTVSLLGQRRIVVNKSKWTGVTIELRQRPGGTTFSFRGYIPSLIYGLLFGGLAAIFLLKPKWRKLEDEVRSFVERSPAFN